MTEITFSEAKSRLSTAMKSEGETVQIDRETAAILAASWPADPQADLTKSAFFSADYMQFLRPVVEEQSGFKPDYAQGITVSPCAEGGVLLIATNSVVCVVAHDKGGSTNGGLRFTAPRSVFDACVPPEPFSLQWEGESVPVGELPDYAIPGMVHACGICLLVMPKGQPAGTLEDDGGALFSWPVSTGNMHREDDYRVYGPSDILGKIGNMMRPLEGAQQIGVTPEPIGVVAKAMSFVQSGYWHMRQYNNVTAWLHNERKDLMIILANARTEADAPEIPSWLGE